LEAQKPDNHMIVPDHRMRAVLGSHN